MNKINKTYKINASIKKVWDALVNPETIEKWGAGPNIEMSEQEGSEFSLWGGDIFGKNVEVKKHKLLKQEWYGGNWDKPSIATFELEEDGDNTKLHLTHTDFPEQVSKEDFDGFAKGWDDFYVGPLSTLLEKE